MAKLELNRAGPTSEGQYLHMNGLTNAVSLVEVYRGGLTGYMYVHFRPGTTAVWAGDERFCDDKWCGPLRTDSVSEPAANTDRHPRIRHISMGPVECFYDDTGAVTRVRFNPANYLFREPVEIRGENLHLDMHNAHITPTPDSPTIAEALGLGGIDKEVQYNIPWDTSATAKRSRPTADDFSPPVEMPTPEPQKWEYDYAVVDLTVLLFKRNSELDRVLRSRAEAGWELVSVVRPYDNFTLLLMFKRPKQEQANG